MDWLFAIADFVWANMRGLWSPASRLFPPYLLVGILIAALAFHLNRRSLAARGVDKFWSWLFDRKQIFSASSLVDLKIVIANRLFTPFMLAASVAATAATAEVVASLILGANGAPEKAAPGVGALIVMTALVTIAGDFTTYWVHRFSHESPVLWPFHKLHHSAETMTPLTVLRKHPVYDLFRALSNAFIAGPVQGVIFAAFGVIDIQTILGVNAVYAVFHWTGSNLRHTHVWLSYGPVWSRIFISPAQHQIHHGCAVRHHDKNYGEIFAVWDWMFGTLYNPEGYEDVEYGVADKLGRRIEQPHPSLAAAYGVPFKECFEALKPDAADQPSADEATA